MGLLLARAATNSLEERQSLLDEVQEREIAEPIAECKASDLDFKISQYDTTAGVGQGWSTKVILKNKGDKPCLTDGSANTVGLLITSGTYELVDTTKCANPESTKPLLLGAGRSWNGTLTWDGHDYQNCKQGDAAAAGTYQLKVMFNGEEQGTAVVTVVGGE